MGEPPWLGGMPAFGEVLRKPDSAYSSCHWPGLPGYYSKDLPQEATQINTLWSDSGCHSLTLCVLWDYSLAHLWASQGPPATPFTYGLAMHPPPKESTELTHRRVVTCVPPWTGLGGFSPEVVTDLLG